MIATGVMYSLLQMRPAPTNKAYIRYVYAQAIIKAKSLRTSALPGSGFVLFISDRGTYRNVHFYRVAPRRTKIWKRVLNDVCRHHLINV